MSHTPKEGLMQKAFYLIANLMAGFMDMGVGALVAVLLALYLGQPVAGLSGIAAVLLWGMFWQVSPDMDIVPSILRRGFTGKPFNFDHHQTWLHWPLAMIPPVALVTWFFLGEYWCAVACVCMFFHYIHDAVFMKNGLAWIFRLRRKFVSYPIQESGTKTPDEWIERNWMQQSRLSIYEMLIGMTALSVAIFFGTHSAFFAALAFNIVWACTSVFWIATKKLKYA